MDHKDVVYFGSCAVIFMLPLAALPLPSSASPIRPFVHPAFATISFGPQSPSTPAAGAKPNTPFQSPPLLPHIASTPTTQGMRQQQQQPQKQQKQQQQQQSLPSRGNLRTPTMSELRQGANAEASHRTAHLPALQFHLTCPLTSFAARAHLRSYRRCGRERRPRSLAQK